jgi:CRP/FNR family cyclic AMP-dependent transcriptional regulator
MKALSFDPQAFLSIEALQKTTCRYLANEHIFWQGEPCGTLFYIQTGSVKLTVVSRHGKEVIAGILEAGDFFAEACLSGQSNHLDSAVVLAPSVILSIAKDEMVRTLRNDAVLSALFISYLLARTVRVQSDLVDHLFKNSEKRLARGTSVAGSLR